MGSSVRHRTVQRPHVFDEAMTSNTSSPRVVPVASERSLALPWNLGLQTVEHLRTQTPGWVKKKNFVCVYICKNIPMVQQTVLFDVAQRGTVTLMGHMVKVPHVAWGHANRMLIGMSRCDLYSSRAAEGVLYGEGGSV